MARTIDDLRSEANRPVEANATMTERDGMQAFARQNDRDAAFMRGDYSDMGYDPQDCQRRCRLERQGGFGGATIDRDRDLG
jgi:hypothetical protein